MRRMIVPILVMLALVYVLLLPLALIMPPACHGAASDQRAQQAYITWITALYGSYPVYAVKEWGQLPVANQDAWARVVERLCH